MATNLTPAANELAALIRRHRLTYDQFRNVCQTARKKVGLKTTKKARRLPALLTQEELNQFFQAAELGSLRDVVLFRLLYYTAVRVSELVSIQIEDVDLRANTIHIRQGKGSKDRVTAFPADFSLVLRAYIKSLPEQNKALFESAQSRAITARRVRQLMVHYQRKAGISKPMHPHLFRHQMLTHLTKSGMKDSEIQLISGHSSKGSLEVYQHLALVDANPAYQKAAKTALDKVAGE